VSSADWQRVARLFDELSELAPAERSERLRAVREEESAEVTAELESLLAADSQPGGALDDDLGAVLPTRSGEPRGAEENLSGRLAGAYRLGQRIGSGGMGTVYAAVRADGLYEQRVAVKVLSAMGSPELLRRFARERVILAGLEHPHIARLLDAGALEQRPYLVMELVEGESLVAHCDRRHADVGSRLRLFLQVCAAVAFAHRRLVVHRDLKPANVLVGAAGEVKLLDFGIASLLDAEGTGAATMTTTRAFTPAYAAPEQVLGQAVTTATDVYALGALLHELLVGRPPEPVWQSPREATIQLTATLSGLPPAEAATIAAARAVERRVLARQLRGDLEAIVATALRREPERRYGSAEALAADVERHLAGLPVAARGQDRSYRARLFARRHRGSLAASVLALLALVGGLWVALAQASEARSEARRASALRRFLVQELGREQREQVAIGPDGPTLGYLLDHGLLDVDRSFAGEPEIAAEVFSIAGDTYRMLAANERAVTALRGALARKRSLYAEGDRRLDTARFDLANALVAAGRIAEAGTLLEPLEGATRGEHDDARSSLLGLLGEQRRRAGDLAGAERATREAVAIQHRLGGGRTAEGANQLMRLAAALYLQGKYRESERLLGEVVTRGHALAKAQARVPGRRGARWGAPLGRTFLAFAQHRAGDLEGAQHNYRHAADGFAELRPPSWAVGHATCGHGLALAEVGDAAAARDLLGRPEVAAADPDHPMARGFGDPGIPCPALAAWARDDLSGFERALAASKVALRSSTRPDRELLRAEMLLARGRAAEALPLCDAAVRSRDASAELQPWRRAEAHLLRGLARCRLGRRAEGLPEVARSADVLRARLPRHRYLRLADTLSRQDARGRAGGREATRF
jgi:eukaryotic-like serine/threonine-protein kinase